MTIPPEVTTALVAVLVAGVPTLVLWLKLQAMTLQAKIRDQKVDEIHAATGAVTSVAVPPTPPAKVP